MKMEKGCTKEALKVLSKKEQEIKENMFKIIIKSNGSNKNVVRVLSWLIHSFKCVK